MLKRARCAIPDGGARVTSFDSAIVSDGDCAHWPLGCSTPAARAEVLRRFDAGTLEFPAPQHIAFTDAIGWFEVPLDDSGLLMIECADTTLFHVLTSYEKRTADPTLELLPESWSQAPRSGERVLVINPWTRRTLVVDRAALLNQPPEVLGQAWATTLDGPPLTMSPGFATFWDGRPSGGMADMFSDEPPPPPPPLQHPVSITVRAIVGAPLPQRVLHLSLGSAEGNWEEVETRTNEHVFRVEAGQYNLIALMPGASPIQRDVDAGADVEVIANLAQELGAWGRVVDERGVAVAGAEVVANGGIVTRTDARGEFAFGGLMPGPRDSESILLGYRRLSAWHPEVGASGELTPDRAGAVKLVLRRRSDVRVRFEAPDGGAVWGIARLGDERSSPNKSVLIRHSELVLDGLAPGPQLLTVLTRDWRAAQVRLEIGAAPVRLVRRLEEKPAISGIVTRDGKPEAGVTLKFVNPPAVWAYEEDTTVTDAQGHFRLSRSLPGMARVQLSPKGPGSSTRMNVKVPSDDLQLELTAP